MSAGLFVNRCGSIIAQASWFSQKSPLIIASVIPSHAENLICQRRSPESSSTLFENPAEQFCRHCEFSYTSDVVEFCASTLHTNFWCGASMNWNSEHRNMRARMLASGLMLWLCMLALVGLATLAASPAQAAPSVGCPTPIAITVASGGSRQIDAAACDLFGTNPQSGVVQPAHGQVTIDDAPAGLLTYVNKGDSATTDFFTFEDASAGVVTVNVTITPASSPVAVTPASLPTPEVSVFYDQTLASSGGVAPYSYTASGGSLPPGLTLASNGRISGTPTGSGPYNYTVHVTDSAPSTPLTADKSYSFTVPGPTMVVSPSSPAAGAQDIAYSQQFSTSGGTAPYTYTLETGSLPPGLALSPNGLLSGTPTTPGSYPFTIKVQDSTTISTGGVWLEPRSVTVVINAAPTVALAPASLPGGAAVGSASSTTIAASGGLAPYSFSSDFLPAGMTLSSAGVLSGTPTASGTFAFTVTATDANGQSGLHPYTLVVGDSTLTLAQASLPSGTTGTAYSQTLTASGGTAPYNFAITTGALPAGLAFSPGGVVSGIPTVGGSFNFTVTATDSTTATAVTTSAAYTLTLAGPTITLAPVSLPANQYAMAYSQVLTANGGTGPYSFAVTAGALPTGLSMSPTGTLSGSPTVFGSFTFTVIATDSEGFTGSRTYMLTIANNPPVANPDTAETLDGKPVTIDVLANDSGTITSIAIVGAPLHGTATSSGTSIVYTPAASFVGSDSLQYTATGPGGTTAPALVTINLRQRPVPVAQNVTTVPGKAVIVDLTKDASGGPFTSANLVSVPSPSSGTTSLNGYQMTFTPASTFEGTLTATFTLSNAYATSAVTAINITVQGRPDPTQDAEVIGLINAQTQAAQRLATTQIGNFNDRLEHLHEERSRQAQSLDIRVGITQNTGGNEPLGYVEDYPVDDPAGRAMGLPQAGADQATGMPPQPSDALFDDTVFWASGFVNFGTSNRGTIDLGHTMAGVSGGVDYRFAPDFVAGIGLGYGRDQTDIGSNGTESTGQAFSAAVYGSYHPAPFYLDGLLGVSRLDFDSTRFVTTTGDFATGNRDGTQIFGSLSAGYEHREGGLLLSPYARIDAAFTQLDGFTESGTGPYSLAFGSQSFDMLAGVVGARAEYSMPMDWGVLTTRGRLEYTHDFAGSSQASMGYADLGTMPFTLDLDDDIRDYLTVGLGIDAKLDNAMTLNFDYRTTFGFDGNGQDHSFGLRFQSQF